MARGVLVALACALVLAGCASPSPDYADYQNKVASSAKAMTSVVNTARLGALAWQRQQVTAAYADTVVTDAEKDAGSVITALDSRQPPDERSIRLKQQVDQPLQDASSALTDLRIALRRADRTGVQQALADLQQPLQRLASLKATGS
jgi:hypothetical protein